MNEEIAQAAVNLLLRLGDIPTRAECAHAEKTMWLCHASDFKLRTDAREIDYRASRLRVLDSGVLIYPRCARCLRPRESVRWREEWRDQICGACVMELNKAERGAIRSWRAKSAPESAPDV